MSPWRRRTVKGLVVLGSLLAFLSVFAIWTERQALNTSDWTKTSGRLLQNGTIRSTLAEYLVEQLYENVEIRKEVERLAGEILPDQVEELKGPAATGLREIAPTLVEKLLETGTAQGLWEDANHTAHEQLLAVLENKKEAVSTANGEVKLNLGSILTNLVGQLGLPSELVEKVPADAGQIKIIDSSELKTAQDIATAIKGLALILSVLTFVVFAGAIYLTRDGRWVTVLSCGIGLVVAGLLVIVARHIAGGIVVDELVTEEKVKPAANVAWGIATSLMISIATTVIVVGLFFCAAGWLSSPSDWARSVRRVLAPVLADYLPWAYGAVVAVFGIYLLSASNVGLREFLTVVVVAAMAAFGVRELSRQTATEFPDARFDDTLSGPREKIAAAFRDARLGERASKIKLPEVKRPDVRLPDVRRPEGNGRSRASRGRSEAAAEAPTATLDVEEARLKRLERLGDLHDRGVLTDEEFAAEKARLLGS